VAIVRRFDCDLCLTTSGHTRLLRHLVLAFGTTNNAWDSSVVPFARFKYFLYSKSKRFHQQRTLIILHTRPNNQLHRSRGPVHDNTVTSASLPRYANSMARQPLPSVPISVGFRSLYRVHKIPLSEALFLTILQYSTRSSFSIPWLARAHLSHTRQGGK
jgi:hypothetical protein